MLSWQVFHHSSTTFYTCANHNPQLLLRFYCPFSNGWKLLNWNLRRTLQRARERLSRNEKSQTLWAFNFFFKKMSFCIQVSTDDDTQVSCIYITYYPRPMNKISFTVYQCNICPCSSALQIIWRSFPVAPPVWWLSPRLWKFTTTGLVLSLINRNDEYRHKLEIVSPIESIKWKFKRAPVPGKSEECVW